MYTIKPIAPSETYAVRNLVLRPGLPVESCIFPGDGLPDTKHFGVYDDKALAGIISLFKNSSPQFTDTNQYQVRGMAVLPAYQKQGLGEKLVRHAEAYVESLGGGLVWFNAREVATGFYIKTGYQLIDSPFDIPGVGTHYVMYKHL